MKKLNTILVGILIIIFLSMGITTVYGTNTIDVEKSNNFLNSLSVEGYTLSPEFNKYTLTYYIVIPSTVNSVNVYAEAENEKATTKISGNTKLSKKENTIKILVTAQNKTTRTYSIVATKQEVNELRLTELEIQGATIHEPLSDMNYNYTANIKSDTDVTDLKVNAVASMENAEIEILGNTGLEAGENVITIILKNGNNVVTYQVTVNVEVEKTVMSEVKNNPVMDVFNKVKDYIVNFFKDDNKTIAVLVAVAVILLILIIILIIKIRK